MVVCWCSRWCLVYGDVYFVLIVVCIFLLCFRGLLLDWFSWWWGWLVDVFCCLVWIWWWWCLVLVCCRVVCWWFVVFYLMIMLRVCVWFGWLCWVIVDNFCFCRWSGDVVVFWLGVVLIVFCVCCCVVWDIWLWWYSVNLGLLVDVGLEGGCCIVCGYWGCCCLWVDGFCRFG